MNEGPWGPISAGSASPQAARSAVETAAPSENGGAWSAEFGEPNEEFRDVKGVPASLGGLGFTPVVEGRMQ